ncbi:MAG: ATP-binding protein [Chloroflexi bacterium]|nr:ATP-binding protein [Chloroflexota bacterium]
MSGRPPQRPAFRPRWWPADEAWPPSHGGPWSHGGPPFMRQLGCMVLVFVIMIALAAMAVAWLVIAAHGPMGPAGRGGPGGPFVLVIAVVLLLAAAGAARNFRRIAGPITEVMAAAQRVEAGDYTVRIPEPRRAPPDLQALVRAMNTMTARLEADEGRRRALMADVSHELRTPLAIIQGETEAMIDGIHQPDAARLGAILDEVQVLSRLVDDLRTLVYSEGGALSLHREPADIGVLAAEAAEGFRSAAGRAGVALALDAPDELPLLEADPVRIREVLDNLLANALRHTPEDGAVNLAVRLEAAAIVITVSDTGPGIAPELLPHVFERFTKGAGSQGSGLGLAIAMRLVLAHGGEISAANPPGGGTVITVRLPLERAE